jgi:hypothetical protein
MGLTISPSGGAATGANSDITSASALTSFGTGSTSTVFSSSGLLQVGGTSSASPAVKKSGTTLQVRLADDSNYGDFRAASYTFSFLNEGNSTVRFRYDGTGGRGEFDNAGKLTWSSTSNFSGSADLGVGRNGVGILEVNNGTAISGTSNAASIKALAFIAAGTATSCTGATIGTGSKNGAGFVTATTTGVSTVVLTFSVTAPTGWAVEVSNQTTANLTRQTGSTQTTATFSGTTVTGDILSYIAVAY